MASARRACLLCNCGRSAPWRSETPVTAVTDCQPCPAHAPRERENAMPESPLAFEILESSPGGYQCSICGNNPATLKCTGMHNGPCCLQCAFSMLADVAQKSVDRRIKKTG